MTANIERMAKEAGFDWSVSHGGKNTLCMASPEEVAKFAALMADDLAKLADEMVDPEWPNDDQSVQAREIADAIRAKYPMLAQSGGKDAAK